MNEILHETKEQLSKLTQNYQKEDRRYSKLLFLGGFCVTGLLVSFSVLSFMASDSRVVKNLVLKQELKSIKKEMHTLNSKVSLMKYAMSQNERKLELSPIFTNRSRSIASVAEMKPIIEKYTFRKQIFAEDVYQSYKIKSGDELMKISYELYGTHHAWPVIKKANPEINERRMKVGRILKVPVLFTE